MNVLQRWFMGTVQPDEITMLMFLAVVLHLVNHRMYESRLPLLIYARRTGFTGFAVILARFLYLDGGIRSGGIRVLMSIALSWFLAGVVGIVVWVMSWVYDDIVMTTLQSWQRSVIKNDETASVNSRNGFGKFEDSRNSNVNSRTPSDCDNSRSSRNAGSVNARNANERTRRSGTP
ncbi:MAG: hypothetical protein R3C12_21455 [Planctomycetaceae bacterium]